jgi:tRNA 2-thiouridine synthesizing protein E
MQVREIIPGRPVHLDAEGFLAPQAEWTPELADAIAKESGVALTPRHWQVITFCREDAARNNGLSPGLRRISQLSGVSMKELYALFPKGPGKLAARIAGLPKPKSCL